MAISIQDVSNFKNSRNRIALLEALLNQDAGIREAAVLALIEIEDARDADSVKDYLTSETDLHIRGQVLPFLHKSKLYDDQEFLDKFLLRTFELAGTVSPSSVNIISMERPKPMEQNISDQKKAGWGWDRILGAVLLLSSFVSFLLMISSPSESRMMHLFSGVLSGAIAIGLFAFANKKSKKKMDIVVSKEVVQPAENEFIEKEHFTRLFHHRDIFAMGILYEGDLPQNMSVTPSMIAREVVLALHQEKKYIDDRLSFHAVIKMERVASYKFFGNEDYNPGSDLDDLMRSCLDDVKKIVVTDDPLIEKIAAQMSKVKVRIPTLGVVWVGMYISMI